MTKKVRVLIADDHPIVRRGLREILDEAEGLVVIAECGDGNAALHVIEEERPDVVVLDVDMPGKDGISVLRELRDREARPEFVMLTMHGREDQLRAAFDLGVKGYVVKDGAMVDIVEAIRAVREGRPYISSTLSTNLLTRQNEAKAPTDRPEALKRLTPAELQVLRLIADFKTSKEIASMLGIHYRTVENRRTSIATKLGLSGTTRCRNSRSRTAIISADRGSAGRAARKASGIRALPQVWKSRDPLRGSALGHGVAWYSGAE